MHARVARSYKEAGYEFDTGVHYVGEVLEKGSLLRNALNHISCGEIEWAPMRGGESGLCYDEVWFGDDKYEFNEGRSEWLKMMKYVF